MPSTGGAAGPDGAAVSLASTGSWPNGPGDRAPSPWGQTMASAIIAAAASAIRENRTRSDMERGYSSVRRRGPTLTGRARPLSRTAMPTLVLLRHGQSQWNLENRFTGWVDVDISPRGEAEAHRGGELMAERSGRAAAVPLGPDQGQSDQHDGGRADRGEEQPILHAPS